MELLEALQIIYKGQSNVAVMAKRLYMPLSALQSEFNSYAASNPIDEDVWKLDGAIGWPYIT